MRYRTRTKPKTYPTVLTVYRIARSGVIETEGYFNLEASPNVVKVMHDTTGNPGGDYNPCRHIEGKLPKPQIQYLQTTPDEFGNNHTYQLSSDGFRPKDCVRTILESPIDGLNELVDGFTARADNEFTTAIQEKVSIPNFLIELIAPLKSLMTSLDQKFKTMMTMWVRSKAKYRNLVWKYKNEGVSQAGSHYLAYQYAIKPFIADMKKIRDSYLAVEKRLNWLIEHNHKDYITRYRQKRDFDFAIEIPIMEPVQTQEGPPPKDLPFVFVYTGQVTCKLTTWATVRFDIPDGLLGPWLGPAVAWLIWTGFLNPLGVGWEATKFSWLIDWFRSDAAKLRQKRLNLSPLPDASILGIGSTLYREYQGELHIVEIANPENSVFAGLLTMKDYDRRPGTLLSRETQLTGDTGLSLWQSSILLALGAQRSRRGKRTL